jgi:acetolactate synthase-1/2/3 large subunit
MAMVDGGELVVRMLEREGVKQVYALQGGHIDAIMQACMDHGVKIYDTRHEQAAGHMADAYARLTGRPGVVVVTAGPGVTDVVTAVANAHLDAVPMVIIGGRHPLAQEEMMPLQELHGVALMQSITKCVRLVRDPKRIPDYMAMAFREATTGRPGPVFLEIPIDVLGAEVDDATVSFPQRYRPQQAPAPSPEAVEMALALLAQAKRPLIMAGRGVWLAGAAAELRQFAELTQLPVIANGMTRGALPEDEHPLSFGSFGTAGTTFLPAAGGPDVVLLLGGRFGLFTGVPNSYVPAQASIIQVDVAAEEIGRFRDVQLGIVADCREALRAFVAAAQERTMEPKREWLDALTRGQAAFRSGFQQIAMTSSEECIHPYRLAYEVNRYLGGDAIIVADGGEMAIWMELAVTPKRPGSYLFHGYLGCLGTGIPFGLAAKAAFPERRVAVVTGDGSVGLNFAEFDTAVRHNLPVVVVIGNDQAWGMCKHEQMLRYGGTERIVATELGPTRYEKAAEGFGVHAQFVERAGDIVPALERAFASGRPACINVMTDPGVISPLVLASASPALRPRPVPQEAR